MSELLKPGWRSAGVIMACGTGILLANAGFRASYGVFLLPMTTELGWTREAFAFALALQNLIWGVGQPFAGAIAGIVYGSPWAIWRAFRPPADHGGSAESVPTLPGSDEVDPTAVGFEIDGGVSPDE